MQCQVANSRVGNATREDTMHTYARRSLLSVIVTAVLTTVNHLYPLGTRALGLGAVLVVVPTALFWWFRTTTSRVAFAGYLLMNLWIVVGFGLIKGLWKSTLPVFLGTVLASVSTSFPRPTLGPVPFELSGILILIGSLFVLYYGYRLVRANHDAAAGAESEKPTARRPALLAGSALVALAVIVGAYAFTNQDRWIAPANGVVKIGVIVPASGPYAILGNSFLKAVEMARSDLRGTKYQYELVLVDIGLDLAQARTRNTAGDHSRESRRDCRRHLPLRPGDKAVSNRSGDSSYVRLQRHLDRRWRLHVHEHSVAGRRSRSVGAGSAAAGHPANRAPHAGLSEHPWSR